jgi:ECF transporter S component (folate family)
LTALGIVLAELVPAVKTPLVQVSFYFVPIVLAAMMYGFAYSVVIAALIDVIGTLLFGVGALNPLFTVTAAINGLIFGLVLYRKNEMTNTGAIVNAIIAAVLSTVLITIIGNTLNIALITYVDKGVTLTERFMALLPARLLQAVVMGPLYAVVIIVLRKLLVPRLKFLGYAPASARV